MSVHTQPGTGDWPRLICPACSALLSVLPAHLECTGCGASYDNGEGVPCLVPDGSDFAETGFSLELLDLLDAREESGLFIFWARCRMVEGLLRRFRPHWDHLRVLDLGCGTGFVARYLTERGAEVVGVDASRASLLRARARGFTRVYEACGETLPFEGGQFDAVVCLDVLEHIDDDLRVIREAYRVLQPEGLFVAMVPAMPGLWRNCDDVIGHKRRYTRQQMRTSLLRAGLSLRHMTGLLPLLVVPAVVFRFLDRLFPARSCDAATILREYRMPPRWVNTLAKGVLACEARAVPWISIPFGVNMAIVAEKGVENHALAGKGGG